MADGMNGPSLLPPALTPPLKGRAIAYDWNEALTTPSPLRGGIEGGGMKAAFLSDLTQKEGGSEAIGVVCTATLYHSPQGGGGRQRCTSSKCNSPARKGDAEATAPVFPSPLRGGGILLEEILR